MSVKPLSLDDSAANSRTSRRRSVLAQPASSAVSRTVGSTLLTGWNEAFMASFRGGGVRNDVASVNFLPLADTQYFQMAVNASRQPRPAAVDCSGVYSQPTQPS